MKLKTKMRRKLAKIKEYFEAQKHYAKRALSRSLEAIKHVLLATSLIFSFSVLVVFLTISAGIFHQGYLEKKVGENTLLIQSMPDSVQQGRGTGFEVRAPSGKLYTLTNAHVCGLANKDKQIQVFDKRFSKRFVAKRVIEVYEDNDLCLVEGFDGYDGLSLASPAEVGDTVWVIGYPLGGSMGIAKGRVKDFNSIKIPANIPVDQCTGPRLSVQKITIFIFELSMCMKSYEAIGTDAFTYPGNSGSPLVNPWGNVVGIIFAANNGTHWGYAVPLKDIQKLLAAY